jgi:hypothetical protein
MGRMKEVPKMDTQFNFLVVEWIYDEILWLIWNWTGISLLCLY